MTGRHGDDQVTLRWSGVAARLSNYLQTIRPTPAVPSLLRRSSPQWTTAVKVRRRKDGQRRFIVPRRPAPARFSANDKIRARSEPKGPCAASLTAASNCRQAQ